MVTNLPGRVQVKIVHADNEEDGEGGNKEPKGHSLRIAKIGCILGVTKL